MFQGMCIANLNASFHGLFNSTAGGGLKKSVSNETAARNRKYKQILQC